MAFMALILGLGLLFYILLGSRYSYIASLDPKPLNIGGSRVVKLRVSEPRLLEDTASPYGLGFGVLAKTI